MTRTRINRALAGAAVAALAVALALGAVALARRLAEDWLRSALGMTPDVLAGDARYRALVRGRRLPTPRLECLQLCSRVHRAHAQRALLDVPRGFRLLDFLWLRGRRCAAALAREPEGSVWVAFRCAAHLDEMFPRLLDARATPAGVHRGVWGAYLGIRDHLRELLCGHAGEVVLTGYSFGAALAAAAAVDLCGRADEQGVVPPGRVTLVALASPPVLTPRAAAALARELAEVLAWAHPRDSIARLPWPGGRFVSLPVSSEPAGGAATSKPHSYGSLL